MNRREFGRLGWVTLIAAGAGELRPAFAQAMAPRRATENATDFTLRIAPTLVELAPQVVISTIGYSNKIPGPLLRVREGRRVSCERHGCSGIRALARVVRTLAPGWSGGRRYTSGTAAWAPPL